MWRVVATQVSVVTSGGTIFHCKAITTCLLGAAMWSMRSSTSHHKWRSRELKVELRHLWILCNAQHYAPNANALKSSEARLANENNIVKGER